MSQLDDHYVHLTIQSLYQATLDETLWPEIVARLKNKPSDNGGPTVMPRAPSDWLPSGVESPNTSLKGLSDSVTQSGYDAGQSALWAALANPPVSVSSAHAHAITANEAHAKPPAARPQDARSLNQVVLNHIHTALEITKKLERLKAREVSLQASLERLAIGMILIDADKQVEGMNDLARAILAQGDLALRGLRLTTADKRARQQLEALIERLVAADARQAVGGGVSIRRFEGHALQVWGAPLDGANAMLSEERPARAILFVFDPDSAPTMPDTLLMEAFGLTRAETALTLALLHGETVDEYCERVGISRNTARTHMRAIFDKLGIQKQTELIRLLVGVRMLDLGPWGGSA